MALSELADGRSNATAVRGGTLRRWLCSNGSQLIASSSTLVADLETFAQRPVGRWRKSCASFVRALVIVLISKFEPILWLQGLQRSVRHCRLRHRHCHYLASPCTMQSPMGKLSKSELVRKLALKSFKECDLDKDGGCGPCPFPTLLAMGLLCQGLNRNHEPHMGSSHHRPPNRTVMETFRPKDSWGRWLACRSLLVHLFSRPFFVPSLLLQARSMSRSCTSACCSCTTN